MKTKLMVLLFSLGLVATACGGSGGSDAGVASLEASEAADAADVGGEDPGAEVDAEQAMLDFAACMRDNGVEIDDPTVDADGNIQFGGFRGGGGDGVAIDREAMEAAMALCQEDLEGVALGFGRRGDFDLTEMQDTFVEYAGCMRENGYDMDDPDLSNFGPGAGGEAGEGGGGGGGGLFGAIDRDDPDFVAAQEVCEDILGGAFGGGPGGGFIRGGDNG